MSILADGLMIKIASSEGVSIYCPENGRFSFFNSPYPAHKSYAAVDVYPKMGFGLPAPSPVSGEVKEILRVLCPERTSFKSSNYDYVILLQSLENPNAWIKILHVKPLVKVGDVVKAGDNLGILLRSGFFDYWTDPHIHVEVRKPSDPIRARGGFKIIREGFSEDPPREVVDLRGVIVEVREEYFLVSLEEDSSFGVPVNIDGELGFIDGGIPHYGYFGVHTLTEAPSGGIVRLCGINIGVIESAHSSTCIAKCLGVSFKVNDTPVKLSFYLYPSRPLIKVIPAMGHNLKIREFEEVSVRESRA